MGLLLECKKKVAIRHHSSPQQALHSTTKSFVSVQTWRFLCPRLALAWWCLSLLSLKFNPHLTSKPQPLPQLTSQLCSNFLHFYGAINLGRTLLLCGQTDSPSGGGRPQSWNTDWGPQYSLYLLYISQQACWNYLNVPLTKPFMGWVSMSLLT